MDDRLTEYDSIRNIYRLKADCNQCENIQKLGVFEDLYDKHKDIIQSWLDER